MGGAEGDAISMRKAKTKATTLNGEERMKLLAWRDPWTVEARLSRRTL